MSTRVDRAGATIVELAAAFPAAFSLDPKLVRPMKLGIKDDLFEQSAISHRRIAAALRSYCNSLPYLRAITEGSVRIDLAGSASGTVTATEAQHAMEALAAICKTGIKRETKLALPTSGSPSLNRAVKQSSRAAGPKGKETGSRVPSTAPTASGQKRLSLSDLRLAAAARKAKG